MKVIHTHFLYKKLKLGTSSEFLNLFPDFTSESFLRVSNFKKDFTGIQEKTKHNFAFKNVIKTNSR